MKKLTLILAVLAGSATFAVAADETTGAKEKGTCPYGGEPGVKCAGRFQALDTNNDGNLTQEEFLAGKKQSAGGSQGAVERFTKLDTNADGIVSQDEFVAGKPAHHRFHGGKKEKKTE